MDRFKPSSPDRPISPVSPLRRKVPLEPVWEASSKKKVSCTLQNYSEYTVNTELIHSEYTENTQWTHSEYDATKSTMGEGKIMQGYRLKPALFCEELWVHVEIRDVNPKWWAVKKASTSLTWVAAFLLSQATCGELEPIHIINVALKIDRRTKDFEACRQLVADFTQSKVQRAPVPCCVEPRLHLRFLLACSRLSDGGKAENSRGRRGDWGGSAGDWGRGIPRLSLARLTFHRGFLFHPFHYLRAWNSLGFYGFSLIPHLLPSPHSKAIALHVASNMAAPVTLPWQVHRLATTWCSSAKCPEPNLPLLIDIQKMKLSWQWIDPWPCPHPRPIGDFAHHLTTLTPLEIKLFIDYIFLYMQTYSYVFEYVCVTTPSTYPSTRIERGSIGERLDHP